MEISYTDQRGQNRIFYTANEDCLDSRTFDQIISTASESSPIHLRRRDVYTSLNMSQFRNLAVCHPIQFRPSLALRSESMQSFKRFDHSFQLVLGLQITGLRLFVTPEASLGVSYTNLSLRQGSEPIWSLGLGLNAGVHIHRFVSAGLLFGLRFTGPDFVGISLGTFAQLQLAPRVYLRLSSAYEYGIQFVEKLWATDVRDVTGMLVPQPMTPLGYYRVENIGVRNSVMLGWQFD